MAAKPLPDQATLLKLLRYEPHTGKLFWRERGSGLFTNPLSQIIWNSRFADKPASTIDPLGYHKIRIFGRQYLSHRVVWKLVTGDDPRIIDHLNGDRGDNRFCNLRDSTARENAKNISLRRRSKSGCNGVVWVERKGCWLAQIRDLEGKYVRLGEFENVDDAIRERKSAERRFGFHPNHGKPRLANMTKIERKGNSERDASVYQDRLSGMVLTAIGAKFGLDPSHVRKICLKQAELENRDLSA